jgi:hypothetical protein
MITGFIIYFYAIIYLLIYLLCNCLHNNYIRVIKHPDDSHRSETFGEK